MLSNINNNNEKNPFYTYWQEIWQICAYFIEGNGERERERERASVGGGSIGFRQSFFFRNEMAVNEHALSHCCVTA